MEKEKSLFSVGDVVTPTPGAKGPDFSYLRYRPVRDRDDEEKYAIGRIWTGKGLRLVHGPELIGKDIWWVAITDEALVKTVEGEKMCKKVYESGDTQVVAWVNELHSGKRNLQKHSPVK